MNKKKILFMMSGSIAAYKACEVISALVKKDFRVQVIRTPSTSQFIGDATLEGLTGLPVLFDLYAPGKQMAHIQLARECDLAILCPGSAHTINSIGNGLADNLVTATFLALPPTCQKLLVPAMNANMYEHPATQNSLRRLCEWGTILVEPEVGTLACGDIGIGRLASVQKILQQIEAQFVNPEKGHILITSGATREPIDGVRFISNVSTGQTGAFLADAFLSRGWHVSYLHGEGGQLPQSSSHPHLQRFKFSDYASLATELKNILARQAFAGVIHLAAVSDYSVQGILSDGHAILTNAQQKLSSEKAELQLILRKNEKLLNQIKIFVPPTLPKPLVIGFKLTQNASESAQHLAVTKLFAQGNVDYVVSNDLMLVNQEQHLFKIWNSALEVLTVGTSKSALSRALMDFCHFEGNPQLEKSGFQDQDQQKEMNL